MDAVSVPYFLAFCFLELAALIAALLAGAKGQWGLMVLSAITYVSTRAYTEHLIQKAHRFYGKLP